MSSGDSFITEVSVDFEYFLHAPYHQLFQIKFRCNAQVKRHIQCIMMSGKRSSRRAAWDRMHHRCFHFQIAAFNEKLTDGLDNFITAGKYLACLFIRDQIKITLAILLFLIG